MPRSGPGQSSKLYYNSLVQTVFCILRTNAHSGIIKILSCDQNKMQRFKPAFVPLVFCFLWHQPPVEEHSEVLCSQPHSQVPQPVPIGRRKGRE